MCVHKDWSLEKEYKSYKWSLHGVIRWKLLFDGEGIRNDEEDVNLLRGIFLLGEMNKFLAVGWDSCGIILGDNTSGHYFILRHLIPTSFFK